MGFFSSKKSSSSTTNNNVEDKRAVSDNGSLSLTGDGNSASVFTYSMDADVARAALETATLMAAMDAEKLAAVTDVSRYAIGQNSALAQDVFSNASGAMQAAMADALGFAKRGQESAFTLVSDTVSGALDFVNLNDQRAADSQRNATLQVASAFQAAGDLSTGNRYIIITGIVIVGIVGFMALRGR